MSVDFKPKLLTHLDTNLSFNEVQVSETESDLEKITKGNGQD